MLMFFFIGTNIPFMQGQRVLTSMIYQMLNVNLHLNSQRWIEIEG